MFFHAFSKKETNNNKKKKILFCCRVTGCNKKKNQMDHLYCAGEDIKYMR